MIVALIGNNSFGRQQALDELVAAFVAEHGDFGLERLDGEEADINRFQEALTSLPFLSGRKLVVLRTPGQNKQFSESAEKLLSNIPETTDAVIIEPKLDKRLAYYKLLKSQTDFREYNDLDAAGLARWLAATTKEQGGSLSTADAGYLVERVGTNQQLLANELDKLLLYDQHISRETIELLTDQRPQSTIFQLLEAAFSGNAKRALALYAEQRALRIEPPQIIALLAWQLHLLAIIKTASDRPADQIAREAKLNPYAVRKSQTIARGLTLAQLKKLISDLLAIDVNSKRTSLDPDEALQNYLLDLAMHDRALR